MDRRDASDIGGYTVEARRIAGEDRVLTRGALAFVADLHRQFQSAREALIAHRARRQEELDTLVAPDFRDDTRAIRDADWSVATAPADLEDRRVEITGPAEPKMMINALNSGARVFMADLEDALSPTWANIVGGQAALQDAVRRTLSFQTPEKRYRLNERVATLIVRPRGWHLEERHVLVDGKPISASLFDFGMYMYHNGQELLDRGTGPYFYLPKLETANEARLWNDVFVAAQGELGIPQGSIRATVLVETLLAAFEMDEILWELREHASGLNAGRWDYLFSVIKKLRHWPDLVLPDRGKITMAAPFMRAYTDQLVRICHRRGAHAIGGMAAFIPSRRDAAVNELVMARVAEDKRRESSAGFDGTWVAHPDLVSLATDTFDQVLGGRAHQKHLLREDVDVQPQQLLDFRVEGASVTEAGVRQNVSVALQYLDSWLRGNGAAAINNLMEDAATAEIARSQLWQWRTTAVRLEDGRNFSAELYAEIREEELLTLGGRSKGRLREVATLLDDLVLTEEFIDFLTVIAYPILE